MSLAQEIVQFVQSIDLFQKNMAPLKEELFNIPIVTKQLIWNYMFGQNDKASNSQLYSFLKKHNVKISNPQVNLIMMIYSSKRDDHLSLEDLWAIFKPLTIKLTNDIMIIRQKKISLCKNMQINYKITDLLCQILQKTLQFLLVGQKMKENIIKCSASDMKIQPLDAAHFQMFINRYSPYLTLKDVDIIFRHIIKNKVSCLKSFQQYFVPLSYHGDQFNPNYNHQNQQAQDLKGLQLIKYHKETVYFMTKQQNKKALYFDKSKKINYF